MADKAPGSKAIIKTPIWARKASIITLVVIVLILVIFGAFYTQEYVAPFRRTIITVDDTDIRMDYFLKRARGAATDPMFMLDVLVNELMIELGTQRYGIEVNQEDINQELKRIAQGVSENIAESEFEEWYRQQLNEAKLTDSEYKEIIRINLLTTRLHEYLAERVSTVAEHVYLHAILLEEYDDAENVKARLEAGEDFAKIAREVSIDEEAREKGGDIGWISRGIMGYGYDEDVFNLDIDDISEILPSPEGYYIVMISEKAVSRELDEDSLQQLRDSTLEKWLNEERRTHEIKYNFNSEINAWINWQLAKK
ncbi:peptidylprolyl isomerase [Chloroflexota bacterium]